MVEGVSWTYCGQCHLWTTGDKEHITTTHICRAVPLDNPRGGNPPAVPTENPAPPYVVLAQAGPANNSAIGVNPKAIMEAEFGGYPCIVGNSVYYGVSLIIMGHFFIGGAVTSESNPPTSNDVDVGSPDSWYYDIFFSDEFRDKLDAYVFYESVKNLHNNVALTNDTAVPTPVDEHPPSDHPVNSYSEPYYSEDDPEPPDYDAPGKCLQYGAYG